RALLIAVKRHKPAKGLILHSDHGSRFTSKEFVRFCQLHFIQQSMIRAGCPYDNAPIERYFNTLKHELIYLFDFKTKFELDKELMKRQFSLQETLRLMLSSLP